MTALAANTVITKEIGDYNDLPLVSGAHPFTGSLVGEVASTGLARALVAGDNFLGLCEKEADNSLGVSGDKTVQILEKIKAEVDVTGVASVADLGATVYASDDATLTLTQGSNSVVGKVVRHVSGTTCVVEFESVYRRSI